jgi:hypothetical protein
MYLITSRIGTLRVQERLDFLRREAECHFENLKEASKDGIKPSKFNAFKSSMKSTLRCIDAIEKAQYQEEYGKKWAWRLRSDKDKAWNDKWSICTSRIR